MTATGQDWRPEDRAPVTRPSTSAVPGGALALAGTVALLVGVALLLVDVDALRPVVPVLLVGVGPTLLSWSAAALARASRLTTTTGTVVAGLASSAAWALATLTTLSWASGFRQADLGVEPSVFAAAFPWFVLGAWVLGVVALVPVLRGLLGGALGPTARWAAAVGCAAPGAALLGVLALAPGGALLAALGLLVGWGLRGRARGRTASGATAPPRPVAPEPAVPAVPVRARRAEPVGEPVRRGALVALALTTAVLGAPFALHALLGSGAPGPTWLPEAWTRLPAMNAGLAGGAVASLPLVAAGGLLAVGRWGRAGVAVWVLVSVAVVANAVSAAMGPVGDAQTYLLIGAAVLAGVAAVVPVAPLVPGPPPGRWAVVLVAGAAAGWAVGLMLLPVLPLVAPVLAVVLAVLVVVRPTARRDADRRVAR